MDFYEKALNLVPTGEEISAEDGSYKIVFLTDRKTGFRLELTWLRDREEPYNLGDLEYHLAMKASDYEASYQLHKELGAICFENPEMGIYFITDPDGYWIEIIP